DVRGRSHERQLVERAQRNAPVANLVAEQPEVRLDAAHASREREDEERGGGALYPAYDGTLLGLSGGVCVCDVGRPSFAMVSPSKSNSTITTGSLPTTQPSWPGSLTTICGARCAITQPSGYSMWISPCTRKPTCACMQSSVPTTGFMSRDHLNPAG